MKKIGYIFVTILLMVSLNLVISVVGVTDLVRRYDIDNNGKIDKNEAVQGLRDYFAGNITKQDALDVVAAYFSGQVITTVENNVTLHLNATNVSSATCKGCHNVSNEVSLRADIQTPHVVHLTSDLLKFECNTCHRSVDLNEVSAAAIHRQVDPGFCAKCHSTFPSVMPDAVKNYDCRTCHSNYNARMEAKGVNAFVNLQSIKATDCLKCHGGAAWYIGN